MELKIEADCVYFLSTCLCTIVPFDTSCHEWSPAMLRFSSHVRRCQTFLRRVAPRSTNAAESSSAAAARAPPVERQPVPDTGVRSEARYPFKEKQSKRETSGNTQSHAGKPLMDQSNRLERRSSLLQVDRLVDRVSSVFVGDISIAGK